MDDALARVSEHSGQENACEFVGLVFVDDLDELEDLVDEFCDPSICQFAEMPSGMIFAHGKAPLIPRPVIDLEDPAEDADYFTAANLSEDWRSHFCGRPVDDETLAWLTLEDLQQLEKPLN